jgi:MarR family transcriptional regulator, organic hydroperoxide resistance regulator
MTALSYCSWRNIVTNEFDRAREDAQEISRLHGAMWHRFHTHKQPILGTDVTPRMLGILRHLAEAGPLTVGEQAIQLGMSRANATEVIDRLQAKGLVERMRDERDQRRVFVWLTAEGRRRVASLADSVIDDPLTAAVGAIPPETRAQIIAGLRALLEAAEPADKLKEERIS